MHGEHKKRWNRRPHNDVKNLRNKPFLNQVNTRHLARRDRYRRAWSTLHREGKRVKRTREMVWRGKEGNLPAPALAGYSMKGDYAYHGGRRKKGEGMMGGGKGSAGGL